MMPFEQPDSAEDSTPQEELSSSATFDPAPLLHAFEQAWQSGNHAPIDVLLSRLPAEDPALASARRRLLEEMVKIDLEHRWRGAAPAGADDLPARPLLEDYLHRFPALGPLDRISLELIGEEYRVRQLWGDRPEHNAYLARFPSPPELPALLARIDAELGERGAASTLLTATSAGAAAVPPGMAPDGYEILGELGRGGMGVVYQARQERLNRLVALKMIRAGVEAGPAALARFRTEAEAAARVQHPHVVQVYEVGEKDGQAFCVMEYLNGGSLAQRLAGAPLEPRIAARLLETLARAVQAIHEQGILHRDLKPSNILLHLSPPDQITTVTSVLLQSPGCTAKISDFGLAKPVESAGLTQTGAVLGTPSYMAPEQADSRSDAIGPATDVYGLGAVLYEMLTGRPPFRGVTVLETLEQVRNHDPLPPRHLQPAVPRDLEIICLKCLQKHPSKRYASAAALADDLERFRQDRPIVARPTGRWERGMKWARRRPAWATLAAALVLGIVVALIGGITYTLNLRAARAETERQRQLAGRSYRKALEAVEQMLVRMGAQQIEAVPGTEKAQVDALTDAIRLYQELLAEQEQPDPEVYAKLSFALSYLGNRQMGLGKPEEAEKNCRRSLELLEQLPSELRDAPACRHQSAFARYILGNILADTDRQAEAVRLYLEACDILKSRGEDLGSRDLLARCYISLAKYTNQPTQRRDYNRRALELCEALYNPDNGDYRNLLAQVLYNLGYELSAENAAEAEKLLERCASLLRPFVEGSPAANEPSMDRVNARNILFHCYSALGNLWTMRGAADKAESLHLKAIDLGEELARLYPHPSERAELANSYRALGSLYHSKQPKKAAQMYRKSIAIVESLARELPKMSIYRVNLAQTYGNLALVSEKAGEGYAVLQKGRDLLGPLMREHPQETIYADTFGNLCTNEGLLFYHHGEPRKALIWYDRAVEVLTAAHRRNPEDGTCTWYCTAALGNRAQAWIALKEHRKALADWDQLIELVGPNRADNYRFRRIMTLMELDEHRRAFEDVRRLVDPQARRSQQGRFACVGVLSHLLEAAENDSHLTKEERAKAQYSYTAAALEALTQLRKEGYFRDLKVWWELISDPDLATLRRRVEFKQWLLKQVGW